MSKSQKQSSLSELEEVRAKTGELGDGSTVPELIFRELEVGGRGRLAEALVESNENVPMLLNIRSLIHRGQFERAQDLALSFEGLAQDKIEHTRCLLELARIAGHKRKWDLVLQIADKALSMVPHPITRMSLNQVRATALFENGRMAEALGSLDAIESLATLFPQVNAKFYAEIQKEKIVFRDRGTEEGFTRLSKLWKRLSDSGDLNPDRVLALLRLEIDIARFAGRNYQSQAYACRLLARSMADELYEGYALIDLRYSGQTAYVSKDLAAASKKFEAIRNLICEIENDEIENDSEVISTTAQGIRENRREPGNLISIETLRTSQEAESLIIAEHGVMIDLKTLEVRLFPQESQIGKAVSALNNEKLSKEEFFAKVWGSQQYVPHLHDELVRSLIHRVRKSLKIKIISERGCLKIQNAWCTQ